VSLKFSKVSHPVAQVLDEFSAEPEPERSTKNPLALNDPITAADGKHISGRQLKVWISSVRDPDAIKVPGDVTVNVRTKV
jgi:hypothetical protein